MKKWNMDLDTAGVRRKMQLLELDEWREKKHITIQRFIKRESRDGMTRESRRSSAQEIRYYFLILG
jgi:hypothetical protein